VTVTVIVVVVGGEISVSVNEKVGVRPSWESVLVVVQGGGRVHFL
jgi:hypothetical protein